MLGVELRSQKLATATCSQALGRGVILLPAGDDGRVLSITPPLSIGREGLAHGLDVVMECLS
jgi:4-aminobutyrate aminotransferase-like enzyme